LRQPQPANRLFAAIDDAAAGEPLGKPSAPPDRRRTRSIEPLEPRRVLDSTVVFNEVMYNSPGPTDDALEWIELSNQMAVDMDLSGWRLDGGVEFEFPFNVRFHPDALFRGVHESVAIVLEAYGFGGELLGSQSINVTSTAGQPRLADVLRISEIHFNPIAEGEYSSSDLEFVELTNISDQHRRHVRRKTLQPRRTPAAGRPIQSAGPGSEIRRWLARIGRWRRVLAHAR